MRVLCKPMARRVFAAGGVVCRAEVYAYGFSACSAMQWWWRHVKRCTRAVVAFTLTCPATPQRHSGGVLAALLRQVVPLDRLHSGIASVLGRPVIPR